jgi:hypothetical protein
MTLKHPAKSEDRPTRRSVLKFVCATTAAGVATVAAASTASAGWGNCSKCQCPAFEQSYDNPNICSNCGHNYDAHW